MAKPKYKFTAPDFKLMVLGEKDYEYHKRNAISYANYELDIKKILKAAKTWVKKNTEYDSKIMFSLSDSNFSSIGKYCYILLEGGQFDEKNMASIDKQLNIIYDKAKEQYDAKQNEPKENEEEVSKKRVGVQEYMRERASEVATELDVMVDDFIQDPKSSPLKNVKLKKFFYSLDKKLKSGHYRFLAEFYLKDISELEEVLSGKDEDLLYAYKSMKKGEIRELLGFYKNITEVAEEFKGKTSTGARAKKPIDKAKKVSKVLYLKEHEVLKVKSVSPIHIIGARSLWVYNTKTKKLGNYVAIDGEGLDVTGTTIKNFNYTSTEATIRSSCPIKLDKFSSLSEKVRRKRFDNLTTIKLKLKGRINEHVILLCVEK